MIHSLQDSKLSFHCHVSWKLNFVELEWVYSTNKMVNNYLISYNKFTWIDVTRLNHFIISAQHIEHKVWSRQKWKMTNIRGSFSFG